MFSTVTGHTIQMLKNIKNTIQASEECGAERMLTKQPDLIYLKFEGATWTVHKDLGRGIYPLNATGKI